MARLWTASWARDHLAELLEAAAEGEPQIIRARGAQAVLISMEQFHRIRQVLERSPPPADPGETPCDDAYAEARGLLAGTRAMASA